MEDEVESLEVLRPEKRRDGGKHYVYLIRVTLRSQKRSYIWRRYSLFDDLRETMGSILGAQVQLPKLTSKRYLTRSATHQVAEHRRPKLQRFLGQLLTFQTNPVIMKTLMFWLTPTADDMAQAKLQGEHNLDTIVVEDEEDVDDEPGCGHGEMLYDYKQDDEHGFEIHAGSAVSLLSIHNDEWFLVEVEGDGRVGYVPLTYVQVLNPIPPPSNPRRSTLSSTSTATFNRGSLASTVVGDETSTSTTPTGPTAPKYAMTPMEELVMTEKTFIQDLIYVRDEFFPKIRCFLSALEAKTFFNNWSELIPINQDLLVALEAKNEPLSAILTQKLPLLAAPYSKYCSGIPAAQQLYEKKIQSKEFQEFEKSFPDLNKPTLNYIMRPVQRIMKYPLLIHEIIKRTPETTESQSLAVAMQTALGLAEHANSTMTQPLKKLDKMSISGPDALSFQRVIGISRGDSNASQEISLLSPSHLNRESSTDGQGPELEAQTMEELVASFDLVSEEKDFDEVDEVGGLSERKDSVKLLKKLDSTLKHMANIFSNTSKKRGSKLTGQDHDEASTMSIEDQSKKFDEWVEIDESSIPEDQNHAESKEKEKEKDEKRGSPKTAKKGFSLSKLFSGGSKTKLVESNTKPVNEGSEDGVVDPSHESTLEAAHVEEEEPTRDAIPIIPPSPRPPPPPLPVENKKVPSSDPPCKPDRSIDDSSDSSHRPPPPSKPLPKPGSLIIPDTFKANPPPPPSKAVPQPSTLVDQRVLDDRSSEAKNRPTVHSPKPSVLQKAPSLDISSSSSSSLSSRPPPSSNSPPKPAKILAKWPPEPSEAGHNHSTPQKNSSIPKTGDPPQVAVPPPKPLRHQTVASATPTSSPHTINNINNNHNQSSAPVKRPSLPSPGSKPVLAQKPVIPANKPKPLITKPKPALHATSNKQGTALRQWPPPAPKDGPEEDEWSSDEES